MKPVSPPRPLGPAGPIGAPLGVPNGASEDVRGSPMGSGVHTESAVQEEAYGEAPTQTLCPHCSKAITTKVRYKRSCLGVGSCLASFLFLGWVGICLGPFLWVALRVSVLDTELIR